MREFRVEGHGDELAVVGAGLRSFGYSREPMLTREGAWAAARELMARKQYGSDVARYHTVKVLRGGVVVWRAFRNVDGYYVDAATGLQVAA